MRGVPRAQRLLLLLIQFHTWWGTCVKVKGKIDDAMTKVDPEEFLWETLPGRCCFDYRAESCTECTVWSEATNFCHGSEDKCAACGQDRYCPQPPPLMDGNKVCTGSSRVSGGCDDQLDTGVCAGFGMVKCQDACRQNHDCNMFTLYLVGRAGSCVLCHNLNEFEDTPNQITRVYGDSFAPPPPGPPGSHQQHWDLLDDSPEAQSRCKYKGTTCDFACAMTNIRSGCEGDELAVLDTHNNGGSCFWCGHFSNDPVGCNLVYYVDPAETEHLTLRRCTLDGDTCRTEPKSESTLCIRTAMPVSSPFPPSPQPPPPTSPPPGVSKDYKCEFHESIEYLVLGRAASNIKDVVAASKEQCCALCFADGKCEKFVYEESTSTCELLPVVTTMNLREAPSEELISGNVLRLSHDEGPHQSCTTYEGSGWAGVSIGKATPPVGFTGISSAQLCCDACTKDLDCGKWTYLVDAHACMFYAAFAERYVTASNVISGVVGGSPGTGLKPAEAWTTVPAPGYPALARFQIKSPPPPQPPPSLQVKLMERIVVVISMALGGAVLFVGASCIACCLFGGRTKSQRGADKSSRRARMPGAKRLRGEEPPPEEAISPWQDECQPEDVVKEPQKRSGGKGQDRPRKGGRGAEKSRLTEADISDNRTAMWRCAELAAKKLVERRVREAAFVKCRAADTELQGAEGNDLGIGDSESGVQLCADRALLHDGGSSASCGGFSRRSLERAPFQDSNGCD